MGPVRVKTASTEYGPVFQVTRMTAIWYLLLDKPKSESSDA